MAKRSQNSRGIPSVNSLIGMVEVLDVIIAEALQHLLSR